MSKNPILIGHAEKHLELEYLRQELTAYLVQLSRALPGSYTSITLICRTDKPDQQIILSNRYDVDADIEALRSAKKEPR